MPIAVIAAATARRASTGAPAGDGGGGGSLALADPGTQSLDNEQVASLALASYVSGAAGAVSYHGMSGTLPRDVALNSSTGAYSGKAQESGSFSHVVRVADTLADRLEADWLARKFGPGVLWAHDFRADAEVDKFRAPDGSGNYQVDGSGTSLIRRITSDGITGGCVEAWTPAGAVNGTRWARPLMPLPGDVGYVSDGTWRTADIGTVWTTNWGGFRRGMFGHKAHWSENAGEGKDGFNYIGDEFWIQVRYKNVNAYDPSHLFMPGGGGAEIGGKVFYVDICGGGSQEIIAQSPIYGSRRFTMYTNFGGQPNSNLSAVQGDTNAGAISAQPGGDWANTCVYDSGYQSCWEYPDDAAGNDKTKFVTLLFHVIPGRQNATGSLTGRTINMASTALYRDTGIEVWKANYGETTYTKVWEKLDYAWAYDATSALWGDPLGFNVFVLSQYMNGDGAGPVPWGRRIAQIICSRKAIACPQVYP